MGKIIITVVLTIIILLGVLFLAKEKDTTDDIESIDLEKAKKIAKEWVTSNATTYVFDGYGLDFLESEVVKERERYKLTFSFTSRAAGYGDRTNELAAQVIVPHVIEIVVEGEKIVSAVTDGDYDEINKIFIEPETKIITVYFVEKIESQEQILEAIREVPSTVELSRAAIEELLKGPSVEEKALGLSTLIPKGTKLLSIDIQDGVAKVDFNKELQKGVRGSARIRAIRSQIEKTLMQFDNIDKVTIIIEGESGGVLQS